MLDSLSKKKNIELLIVLVLIFILSIINVIPIFFKLNSLIKEADWDLGFFYHYLPYITIHYFKEFPLWNPYSLGGIPYLANPHSNTLTPFYIFYLITNPFIAIRLEIWAHLLMGMIGMYFLAKHFVKESYMAFMSMIIFAFSGWYSFHMYIGHKTFTAAMYLPLIFYFYIKDDKLFRYNILCAFFISLTYLDGGPYVFMQSFLVIGFTCLFFIITNYKNDWIHWRYILVNIISRTVITVTLSACLCAIKLLPAIYVNDGIRKVKDISGYSIVGLIYYLTHIQKLRDYLKVYHSDLRQGIHYSDWENETYIGLIALIFIAIGFYKYFKKYLLISYLSIVFLILSLGNNVPRFMKCDDLKYGCTPWDLIHLLPGYDSMRVTMRFKWVFLMFLSIYVGLGFSFIYNYLIKKNFNKIVTFTFMLLLALTNLYLLMEFNYNRFSDGFFKIDDYHKEYTEKLNFPFAQTEAKNISMSKSILNNKGVVNAYEPAPHTSYVIANTDPKYKGEFYLKDNFGKAQLLSWSPNKFSVRINVISDDYLIVNQNYAYGWKVKEDRSVENSTGLISVKVSPNDKIINFYYLPNTFIIGTIISLCTLLILLSYSFYKAYLIRHKLSVHSTFDIHR